MTRPTTTSLVRDSLRDLVVDVRCAERDGLPDYAAKCRADIARIWPLRHTASIGRYGQVLVSK